MGRGLHPLLSEGWHWSHLECSGKRGRWSRKLHPASHNLPGIWTEQMRMAWCAKPLSAAFSVGSGCMERASKEEKGTAPSPIKKARVVPSTPPEPGAQPALPRGEVPTSVHRKAKSCPLLLLIPFAACAPALISPSIAQASITFCTPLHLFVLFNLSNTYPALTMGQVLKNVNWFDPHYDPYNVGPFLPSFHRKEK